MFSKKEAFALLECKEIIKEFPISGQKQVYLIEDFSGNKIIAKIVKDNDLRVQREVEIITNNKLSFVPRIINTKKISTDSGETYLRIFEEFIDGETLKSRLKMQKLSTSEGIKLMTTLLTIATQLESISVVHRDIKPDNIICGLNEDYFLIDFGIARQLDNFSLTMTKATVGPHTPGYGAPELFQYRVC